MFWYFFSLAECPTALWTPTTIRCSVISHVTTRTRNSSATPSSAARNRRWGKKKTILCDRYLISPSPSQAEAITLTVAQAFNIAFERWQSHKKKKAARQQQQQQQQQQQKLQGGGPGQKDTTTTTKVANGGTPSAAAEDSTQPVADLLGELGSIPAGRVVVFIHVAVFLTCRKDTF